MCHGKNAGHCRLREDLKNSWRVRKIKEPRNNN